MLSEAEDCRHAVFERALGNFRPPRYIGSVEGNNQPARSPGGRRPDHFIEVCGCSLDDGKLDAVPTCGNLDVECP